MSIKIHDGYRFKGSLMDLYAILENLRDTYYNKAVSFAQEFKHRFIIQALYLPKYITIEEFKELYKLQEEDLSTPISLIAEDRIMKFFEKHAKLNDINIYPHSSRELLLYPFLNSFFKKFINFEEHFEKYGYWNNSDKPKDVSSQQWRARGKKWEKILDKSGTFYEAGLSFHLLDSEYFIFENEVLDNIEEKNNIEYIEKNIRNIINPKKNTNFVFDKQLYNIDRKLINLSLRDLYTTKIYQSITGERG